MLKRLVLAVLTVLVGVGGQAFTVEARHDIYATTYHGNNWYVDQDSVKKVGDVVDFKVYTTAGLEYDVHSGMDYYNADVYYGDQKLTSDNGQSLYKYPAMLAAMRVARR